VPEIHGGGLATAPTFHTMTLPDDIRSLIAEEKRREKLALGAVLDGVRDADLERFIEGLSRLDIVLYGWRKAMRRIVRLEPDPPRAFREGMLRAWVRYGDHIRLETGDDLLLVKALRALLPPYDGRRCASGGAIARGTGDAAPTACRGPWDHGP
jgi:hypothetical protein